MLTASMVLDLVLDVRPFASFEGRFSPSTSFPARLMAVPTRRQSHPLPMLSPRPLPPLAASTIRRPLESATRITQ